MHELGIVIGIVEQMEKYAKVNNLTAIEKLVLEVGEISQVVPHYLEDVYPMAVENTMLQNTELQINIIPARGLCRDCHAVYNVLKYDKVCPKCGKQNYKLLSGIEFNIKEIIAY